VTRDQDLRSFIRCTLGCDCPDEVLRSIHCSTAHPASGCPPPATRLDVGGRLLVYVLRPGSEHLATTVAAAIAAGVGERDRLGFNRFRLVIADDDPEPLRTAAEDAFAACPERDDKTHLHVEALEDLPEGV
jgi:hypothetical protein